PFAHGDLEFAAIDARLALFVEKPVALSLDLARQVAAAIQRKGLVASSGYQTRYSEAADRAKELIANRPVGMALGFYLGGLPGRRPRPGPGPAAGSVGDDAQGSQPGPERRVPLELEHDAHPGPGLRRGRRAARSRPRALLLPRRGQDAGRHPRRRRERPQRQA